ncbi:MAG: PQQ-like beta-propeller repeat protein [Bacteroidetes bacterium]|nr:PQQ-like beta-propeller repeat protein [Bacteroidota bacterium]
MNTKNKKTLLSISLIITLTTLWINLQAQDWPQWQGPNRNNLLTTTELRLDWSEHQPPLMWTFREAGSGFSAPSIVGNTLYGQGAGGGNDFAFALDTKTGHLKWKQILGEEHVSFQNRGNGPRGSVTVDGDNLYLIRGGGQLHCLAATDGKMIWQHDFQTDFGGALMTDWGFSESPLVDGNLVICAPGSSQGSLMAFDKQSGAVVWKASELTDKCTYSSPVVTEVAGIRQYIQLTEKCIAGVAAKDGKVLWKVDAPAFKTAVISTPIVFDNLVYVTTGYNFGCILIQLSKEGDTFKAQTLYANKNMVNHHGGVVLIHGYVYGYSETFGWVCQDVNTGENVWTQRSREAGKGSLIAVNDRLLLLDMTTGLLTVTAASPEGWKEFGQLPIPERTTIETMDNQVWTHPVVANGKLYVRDHDLLFCFDLTK